VQSFIFDGIKNFVIWDRSCFADRKRLLLDTLLEVPCPSGVSTDVSTDVSVESTFPVGKLNAAMFAVKFPTYASILG
jgi:hypothetical protein